jgi:prepilin-type N-terminal cleavage/methylation domain-containing protein
VKPSRAGVTLVEMLMVVAIISLIAAVSFPSISSGLDTIRLSGAADDIVTFLNGALNRAERRRVPVEVILSKQENRLVMRSVEPGWEKRLDLPPEVRIEKLLPETPGADDRVRTILLYPGGSVPRAGVEIVSSRGLRRIVQVDPITGVPEIRSPEVRSP